MSKKVSAMARLISSLFCILIPTLLLYPISCLSETQNPKSRAAEVAAALFIFGDSFFDSGNNNYINTTTLDQANFWPYGETYFKFPTGRFSDGRLISDFIGKIWNPFVQLPAMQIHLPYRPTSPFHPLPFTLPFFYLSFSL